MALVAALVTLFTHVGGFVAVFQRYPDGMLTVRAGCGARSRRADAVARGSTSWS
jgi:hypothetical protein